MAAKDAEGLRSSEQMSSTTKAAICQQCGSGFIQTSSYLDLLARRQVHVVVPVLCPTCFLTKGPLPKERGKVKWFNPKKHYGFIISEAGEEVFFHRDQVLRPDHPDPKEGQDVRFHLHYPIKGPEALNVELIEE
jgi:cold shock CspA family protein